MAPFDGAGNYSLPAGSDVVTGDVAVASDLNIPLDDIEAALSQVLLRSGVAPMTGGISMSDGTSITWNAGEVIIAQTDGFLVIGGSGFSQLSVQGDIAVTGRFSFGGLGNSWHTTNNSQPYCQMLNVSSAFVGNITIGAASTAYNTTSDERLKHARRPLADAGDIIDQLQPIRFRWNGIDGPEDFGFSAQELHAVVPQAATPGKGDPGDKDFVPWMIQHGRLEAILVAEIQALRARVAALEAAAGV